jgi:perosamine synthetase
MKSEINKPAILGGNPTIEQNNVKYDCWPLLDDADEKSVLKVMRDGDISTHPIIHKLEEDYKSFTNAKYALAHNNGTSALLAAFFALDLNPDDEILVPSATFWASALPMLWLGLVPVFCDSESSSLGICPKAIEKSITAKTKAIVVVHLWGFPCQMDEIYKISKKYNLKIIEDASHAHGATWQGKQCGTLGDIGVLSLQGDKLAPAGEGGILLTNNYDYYERAICLGDITRIIELETPQRRFAATSFGVKTRIAPLSAAIGVEQLKKLKKHNQMRNENIIYLSGKLEKLGFNCYLDTKQSKRTYFEFIISYDENKIPIPTSLLVDALCKEGCKVSLPRYVLLHQQPFFTEGHFKKILRSRLADDELPNYQELKLPNVEGMTSFVKLPNFTTANRAILDNYANAFEKVVRYAESIVSEN